MENKKKIICFGLGKVYKMFLNLYDNSKVESIALSDNNIIHYKENFDKMIKPEKS